MGSEGFPAGAPGEKRPGRGRRDKSRQPRAIGTGGALSEISAPPVLPWIAHDGTVVPWVDRLLQVETGSPCVRLWVSLDAP
jgi:hypothetical protein